LTISTGVKQLTVESGLSYSTAHSILITYDIDNFMEATVTSYNPSTGVMDVDVNSVTGSGTYSSWTVSLAGSPGPAGTSGTSGSSGVSGSSGSSGTSGVKGEDGTSGSSGTSGINGTSGSSGSSGNSGTSGSSGVSGTSGTSGVLLLEEPDPIVNGHIWIV